MGVKATDLRKGMVIDQDGDLLLITEYEHKTPGNLRAIINVSLRSLKTGSTRSLRLGSSDMLEVAWLDKKKCEYLYKESSGDYVFMEADTYEQFHLSPEFVGDKMSYVRENTQVEVTFNGTAPVGVVLPGSVVLKVVEAEAAVKGNTSGTVKKEVVLETGLRIKVPLHVSAGDEVRISTITGDFQGRA
jgi:elongation factor P